MRSAKRRRMPLLLIKAVERRNRQSRPAQLRKESVEGYGSKPRQEWELRLLHAINGVVCWSSQSREEC